LRLPDGDGNYQQVDRAGEYTRPGPAVSLEGAEITAFRRITDRLVAANAGVHRSRGIPRQSDAFDRAIADFSTPQRRPERKTSKLSSARDLYQRIASVEARGTHVVAASLSLPQITTGVHVFLTRQRDLDYRHRDMTTTRPYESPLRAEQLEQTRLRILEATAEVLADEEVGEVTVPLVAMRARVSLRTVYRHFPTKEVLFDAFGEWGEEHLRLPALSYPETLDEIREMAPQLYRMYEESAPLMRALLSKRGQEIRARTRPARLRTFEKAMREVTAALGPAERRRALAVVYLLVSAPAWQAMRDQ
jgi:AcrR family transcriptional regulator